MQSFQATRRNLPHWQEPASIYFIAWRCTKGHILSPKERDITLNALRHWDGVKWTLYAAVIMPDHVHALAQPMPSPEGGAFNLAAILHSVKRYSSRRINQLRGTQGSFWQDERYDRIVRDEAELHKHWQYIRNNAVQKGLSTHPGEYPWLYEKGRESTG